MLCVRRAEGSSRRVTGGWSRHHPTCHHQTPTTQQPCSRVLVRVVPSPRPIRRMRRLAGRATTAACQTVPVRRPGTQISAVRTAGRCGRRADSIKPRQVAVFLIATVFSHTSCFGVSTHLGQDRSSFSRRLALAVDALVSAFAVGPQASVVFQRGVGMLIGALSDSRPTPRPANVQGCEGASKRCGAPGGKPRHRHVTPSVRRSTPSTTSCKRVRWPAFERSLYGLC